ncbi:hypothetical protein [Nocardia otitidiscaviarum]|uniref:hypothetical protein n=1 Tax=Nocardia otitidiscaviarum TaxID=1823 RepID=UPI002453F137|nr:hypothetical protein [Nocardia otitidiscaviarum]
MNATEPEGSPMESDSQNLPRIERIYRATGTLRHGGSAVHRAAGDALTARQFAKQQNAQGARKGWPQDWRAEYADIEWKPLTKETE